MTNRLKPYSDRASRESVSYEFHELLKQAVQIERKKTLLDILKIIDNISDKRYDKSGLPKESIKADEYKRAVKSQILSLVDKAF